MAPSKRRAAITAAVIAIATHAGAHMGVEYFDVIGPSFAWLGGLLTAFWIELTAKEIEEANND